MIAKFSAIAYSPKLTFARSRRKAVIDEVSNLITLYETTVKIEISIPSILQGLKEKVENIATKYLVGLFSNNLVMVAVG